MLPSTWRFSRYSDNLFISDRIQKFMNFPTISKIDQTGVESVWERIKRPDVRCSDDYHSSEVAKELHVTTCISEKLSHQKETRK